MLLTNPSNDLITTSYFAKYSSIMKIVHIRESFTPDRVGKLDPNMADMVNLQNILKSLVLELSVRLL